MESKCYECKNLMKVDILDKVVMDFCTLGGSNVPIMQITSCSHFIQKPKESKELLDKVTKDLKEETPNKDGKYNYVCQCGCYGKSIGSGGLCNNCAKGKHAEKDVGA